MGRRGERAAGVAATPGAIPGRAIRPASVRLAALAGALGLAACGGTSGPPDGRPSVAIVSGPTTVRQGDVVGYAARAEGSAAGSALEWSVVPTSAGLIDADGRFVGYEPGALRIVARAGMATDTLDVQVQPRGLAAGRFEVVGRGEVTARFTSDVWVHGDVAYTGTWGGRTTDVTRFGDRLYVWDVSAPSTPVLTDSLVVDARTVNDVKIRADGTLAALTHEADTSAADGLNGITLLDLSDPRHPRPIIRYTDGLELGVHNVWIEGDVVYVVADGTQPAGGSGLHVIDISDPAAPEEVATFWGGGPAGLGSDFLHDVYVRDGLAFLSHWDAGLVILDVGNGIMGGSPENPAEVGRVRTEGGNTHNAWYWPETGYVFVGDEYGDRMSMHVVDARDLANPREVAIHSVPGDTPHNFWLDEENGILYMAWYTQGIRALDVTGELLGELQRQGREIA